MVDQLYYEYTPLYVAFAVLTMLLCVYVVISYFRNAEYRKPPAGLMLCKTSTDLVFSVTFFIMLFFVDRHNNTIDNDNLPACNIYGPIFVTVFIASQSYFTAICWDLYRTLSNPFRIPAADSKKLHAFVWIFSAILVVGVAPFNVFRYRVAYGICFSCNTGTQFNYYNLWLFYIPIFITNVSGFLVTIFAFRRLSNGLEKTFELRQQIIKKQLILVGLLTSLSVITVISWGILIYAPSFSQQCVHDAAYMCLKTYPTDPHCMDAFVLSNQPRVLLSTLVFLNGFFDALGWYLIQRLVNKTTHNKISKQIDVSSACAGGRTHTEMLIGTISLEHGEDDIASNNKSEQVLCNALRGEIIAYMTAGLAESIKNTSKETYDRLYSYADSMDIPSLNDHDESFQIDFPSHSHRSGVTPHHAHQDTMLDHLECEEPEPQRAQYPMHIHHDPKTHQGVINEIFVCLPNQSVPHKVIKTFKRSMLISSSVAPEDSEIIKAPQLRPIMDDGKEAANAKEEYGSMDDCLKPKPKMQTLYFEDAPPCGVEPQTSTSSTVATLFRSISRTLSRVISPATTRMPTRRSMHAHAHPSYHVDSDDDVVDKDAAAAVSVPHPPPSYAHVPFKDYAPHCFRYLRQQIYNISDEEYLKSVRPPGIEEQSRLVKEKFSEGRSGAFFFFTHDSKYIIKTVNKQEAMLLLEILPSFIQHFALNPHSLINRFFGLHSITMYNLCLYFVVLENVFVAGSKPHEIYDIKGSWIDRHTNHHVESGKLMKDQDLHKTLKLLPGIADNMYKQLKSDSKFLAQHNIMDYSVLLGIYYVGIDPVDVTNDRIMLQHHDNAISNALGTYAPPHTATAASEDPPLEEKSSADCTTEEENSNAYHDEESMNNHILTGSTEEFFPEDLETVRNLPDGLTPEQLRPRAPSYHSGLRKYAQKDKAVKARVIEGPGIYYLGIIDVLQEWNTMKKLERMAKVYLRCKSKDGVSCVEPKYYRKRFLRKMYRIGIRPNNM